MEKSQLRAAALAQRRALAPEAVEAKSQAIASRLYALEAFRQAATLLAYVSSKDNEAGTHGILQSALDAEKTLLVPLVESNGVMHWSRLEALSELAPGRYGILEPQPQYRRIETPPNDALCLVPGLAFTRQGHRIGHGSGCFDRFLATFEGAAIGLAFDCQLRDTLPQEAHDRPVALLVTESACYPCAPEDPK